MPGGLAQIVCNIDPLMSHRNEIYGLTCFVERQENITNPYFTDPLLPIAQGTIIEAIDVGAVGSASDTRTMYFTCIGGIEANE